MKVVARIEKTVQVGPDSWRIYPVTRVFDSTATVQEITEWAQSHDHTNRINHVELSQPEGEVEP